MRKIAVHQIHLGEQIVIEPGQPFDCPDEVADSLQAQGAVRDPNPDEDGPPDAPGEPGNGSEPGDPGTPGDQISGTDSGMSGDSGDQGAAPGIM